MCLNEPSINPRSLQDVVYLSEEISSLLDNTLASIDVQEWGRNRTSKFDLYPRILIHEDGLNLFQVNYDEDIDKEPGKKSQLGVCRYYVDLYKDYGGWRPQGVNIIQPSPDSATFLLQSLNYNEKLDTFDWEARWKDRSNYRFFTISPENNSPIVDVSKTEANELILNVIEQLIHILQTGVKNPDIEAQIIGKFEVLAKDKKID